TAFRGIESEADAIRGKYFNEIVRDLRCLARGSTLERVLDWMAGLHGFLSSPTGGGIRHGLDLNMGIPIGQPKLVSSATSFAATLAIYSQSMSGSGRREHKKGRARRCSGQGDSDGSSRSGQGIGLGSFCPHR